MAIGSYPKVEQCNVLDGRGVSPAALTVRCTAHPERGVVDVLARAVRCATSAGSGRVTTRRRVDRDLRADAKVRTFRILAGSRIRTDANGSGSRGVACDASGRGCAAICRSSSRARARRSNVLPYRFRRREAHAHSINSSAAPARTTARGAITVMCASGHDL